MAGTFTPGTGADFHYRGTTDGGAPSSGDFVLGDWVETPTGIALCRIGGSPGTWSDLAFTPTGATVPAVIAAVTGDGATDDVAAIQAALDLAHTNTGGLVVVPFRGVGVCIVSAALIIYSNTRLQIADGVTIRQKVGSTGNMLVNAAKSTTAKGAMDGASTATSTDVTSASFLAGDIGKAFTIWGAGTAYAAMSGTVTSAGHGTLASPAVTTIASAYVAIGPRDNDIEVSGGTWDMGANLPPVNGGGYFTRFRRVDRLKIHGCRFTGTNGTNANYAVNAGDVTDFVIEDIDLSVPRDGVHIEGPASVGVISNIRGSTGDDFVAIMPTNSTGYNDTHGPVSDISVTNLVLKNASSGLAIMGASANFGVKDIKVDRIIGTIVGGSPVRVEEDAPNGLGYTSVQGLSISHIDVSNGTSGNPYIRLGGQGIQDVTIDDIVHRDGLTSAMLSVAAGKTVDHLTIKGIRSFGNPTQNMIQVDGIVNDMLLEGVDVVFGAGGRLVLVSATGTLARLTVTDWHLKGSAAGRGELFRQNNGAGAALVFISNGVGTSLSYLCVVGGTTTFYINNIRTDTFGNANIFASHTAAVIVIHGGVWHQIADGGYVTTGAATIRVNCMMFRIDVNLITNPADGDVAFNSNGARACGVGPAVYNVGANKWKGLYSGVTN